MTLDHFYRWFALGLIASGATMAGLARRAPALRVAPPVRNTDAIQRGCRDGGFQDRNRTNPSWVSVRPEDRPVVLEGTVLESRAATNDFPTVHGTHDWNYMVKPAPGYEGLLSDAAEDIGGQKVIECEWETKYFPEEFFPSPGDTSWTIGRYIFDCGHPPYRTEIHPPKGVAFTRLSPYTFNGDTVPSMTNKTAVYFNSHGGYFYDPIGGQDYTFQVPLPPKPSATAVLKYEVVSVPMGRVRPILSVGTPPGRFDAGTLQFKQDAERSVIQRPLGGIKPPLQKVDLPTATLTAAPTHLNVTFPLKDFRDVAPARWSLYGNPLSAQPRDPARNFGAVIAAGWREPTLTQGYRTLRVTLDSLKVNDDHDPLADGEWKFWVRVNDVWTKIDGLGDVGSGDTVNIGRAITITVPLSGKVEIGTTGWESDPIDDLFGLRAPGDIPASGKLLDENDSIGEFSRQYRAAQNFGIGIAHDTPSRTRDYNLRYHIEEVARFNPGQSNAGGAVTRKRVTLRIESIKVLDDADTAGDGDIWFDFTVNGQKERSPRSGQQKIGSGNTVNVGRSFAFDLTRTDRLDLNIQGTDDDPIGTDSLGKVVQNYDWNANFGAGVHTARSNKSDGQFEVTYRIDVRDL